MKKYLPLILFLIGLLVFVGVIVVKSRSNNSEVVDEEDEQVAELPLQNRPFTTLTPSADGHTLTLRIQNIDVPQAVMLDYELVYTVADGRLQGVPGSVELEGEDLERDLLLGSESSGKKRYDEGVEKGTLTLRFRNDAGKLVGKLATDFHLQNNTDALTSIDNKFQFLLSKPSKAFFVTMMTFGLPEMTDGMLSGPYGVFTAEGTKVGGEPKLGGGTVYSFTGSDWKNAISESSTGVFITK